jgi:hypothetical protein
VVTASIVDDAVTAAKLANTSVTAGSYGSATGIYKCYQHLYYTSSR